ncbi:MAG: hypothetical protein QXR19_16890 [Candidatus Jordarchaeaceae archaeon]
MNYLLNLLLKEDGITLDEALSIMRSRLGITKLEALTIYFKSKEERLLSVQLNQELKPCLWLSAKGLKWIHERGLQAEAPAVVGGGIVE